MCLEKDLLGYIRAYMSKEFISGIDLDVRYKNWNNRDGSRDGSVTIGVLFGGNYLKRVVDDYHFDHEEVNDTKDIGVGYFAFLQELLARRTSGLRWQVDSKRVLTLRLSRVGRPEDVRVIEDGQFLLDLA